MAAMSGMGGNVTFANGHTTGVKAWTAELERDTAEANHWNDAAGLWVHTLTGLCRMSGTYTCEVDTVTTLIIDDMVSETGDASFQFASGYTLDGTIMITGSSTGAERTAEATLITINWKLDAAPSINPPGTDSATASA